MFQNHSKYEYKYKYYSNSTQICLKMLREKQVKVHKMVKYGKNNKKICQNLQKKTQI